MEHRLDEAGAVDYEVMKTIIEDVAFVDLRSIRFKDHLLDALDGADLTETEQQAKAQLASWGHYRQADGEDHTGEYPAAGYTIWDATFPKILQNVFAETFGRGRTARRRTSNYDYGRGTLMRVLNPDATALSVAADYVGDGPDDELVRAFKTAVSELGEQYDGEPSTWRSDARIETFNNMALFGMPIGVTTAGEMAWVNRGTENHIVRLGDDPTAENVVPRATTGTSPPTARRPTTTRTSSSCSATSSTRNCGSATARSTPPRCRPASYNARTRPTRRRLRRPSTRRWTRRRRRETDQGATGTPTSSGSGPGFTALTGAAAAVLGSALVWLRERKDE